MTVSLQDPKHTMAPQKTVSIETYGCQMNVADSEDMLAALCDEYTLSTSAEKSDLVILNTCHIREKAYHKVVSRLGKLRLLKEKHHKLRIVVAGCVAQAEGKKMLRSLPMIDIIVGPGRIHDLKTLLKDHERYKTPQLAIGFPKKTTPTTDTQETQEPQTKLHLHPGKNPVSRFVTIQSGCDNYCTFCVVPHTRGHEISVKQEDVHKKVQSMLARGAQEIFLLGQNVNSYGADLLREGIIQASKNGPFYDLLTSLLKIDHHFRLRFTTSNPHDFTYPLSQLFRHHQRLGKYYHLPVQSGSAHILQAMKRKVTPSEYMEKISWLRESIKDMAISTDIIVGFPGESDDDFDATYAMVQEVQYSFIYAFRYSPRNHTPAKRFAHQVDEDIKAKRLLALQQLQDSITCKLNEKEIGQTREVLFLYPSSKEKHAYYGRTEHFRLVKVVSPKQPLTGKILPVNIIKASKTTLEAQLLST
ncbi:MAG: tRNA (N6-isopentenyl adenosine(37)-C2)-methylthiotransferase MiaB [Proteobacteria bacterium]|nr:tRNA (N6-isopentenyl adenosine(37)-C2)-methylthiotransferase MiaB [Pseudomonadota bacterium]